MNLSSIGWRQVIRGVQQGRQGLLFAGLGLVLFQKMRDGTSERQLIYRKKLPVGSTIVVRHARRGRPRIKVTRSGDSGIEGQDQTPPD